MQLLSAELRRAGAIARAWQSLLHCNTGHWILQLSHQHPVDAIEAAVSPSLSLSAQSSPAQRFLHGNTLNGQHLNTHHCETIYCWINVTFRAQQCTATGRARAYTWLSARCSLLVTRLSRYNAVITQFCYLLSCSRECILPAQSCTSTLERVGDGSSHHDVHVYLQNLKCQNRC